MSERRAPARRSFGLSLAAAALLLPTGALAQQPGSRSAVELGAQLYQREGCPICHRLRGEGGNIGPALDDAAKRLPDPAWYVEFLRDPAAVVKGSVMPAFAQLSDDQRGALAAFLLAPP